MSTYKFTRHAQSTSIYTRFRVKNSMRATQSPRVAKAWRTRKLMNLTAFFRNRFYEIDRWYKARIEKPEIYPNCYFIDPSKFTKSLVERLADLHFESHGESEPINIGMAYNKTNPKEAVVSKTYDANLEKLARLKHLQLDPTEIESDPLTEHVRVLMSKCFSQHFGIFRDLFHPDAFFYPVIDLQVEYALKTNPDKALCVFTGNDLSPSETTTTPGVKFKADPDSLYTLIMVNADGCLYEENKEVLHWFVSNIPGDEIEKGQTMCSYMQPLPPKGTGWNRIVFVLFKQERKVTEFTMIFDEKIKKNLESRSFNTADFYLKFQDIITPIGLSFFQTSWDDSCTTYFHDVLNIEQPIYTFDWPEPHFEEQVEFPEEYQSFNEYLDKYRDPKDIDKEILLKRLKQTSPFKPEAARLNFPNIFAREDRFLPTWQRVEKVKENEAYGKYKGIYENRLE